MNESHLDQNDHVNNIVYLIWIQEAATRHWQSLTHPAIDENYFWVVLRHEIDYKLQAVLGDRIQIETWVETAEGVKSDRRVEIRRYSDGKLLCQSKTTWCLMSKVQGKPSRIPTEIRELFFLH